MALSEDVKPHSLHLESFLQIEFFHNKGTT